MNVRNIGLAAVLATTALAAGCGGGGDDNGGAAAGGSGSSASNGGASDSGTGGNGSGQAGSAAAVTVKTFMFQPDPIEIEAGDTVTWTNNDTAVHTVTSGERDRPDGEFDEKLAESGGKTERTFREPGTYAYFCSLHSGPGMEGTVVVR